MVLSFWWNTSNLLEVIEKMYFFNKVNFIELVEIIRNNDCSWKALHERSKWYLVVLDTRNQKWIHSYLEKPREGKCFGSNSKSQLFYSHTWQRSGHFSYWSDEFHLSIFRCWSQRRRGGNLLSFSFLLRCGTRPYERDTQWDSNTLV